MKRMTWTLGILVAICAATAVAQPPGGPNGPGNRGGQGGGPGGGGPGGPGMKPPPVIEVLDADHDHVISSEELKNATSALLTLDKNNDGKLTVNEFAPHGGGPGAGPGNGRGQTGRVEGGTSRRLPPGSQSATGGAAGKGPAGGPGIGPEGAFHQPNPERMVEHMMEFDADKDGKLSKEEMSKFAEDFIKSHPGPGGLGFGGGPNGGERPARPQRPEE